MIEHSSGRRQHQTSALNSVDHNFPIRRLSARGSVMKVLCLVKLSKAVRDFHLMMSKQMKFADCFQKSKSWIELAEWTKARNIFFDYFVRPLNKSFFFLCWLLLSAMHPPVSYGGDPHRYFQKEVVDLRCCVHFTSLLFFVNML